MKTNLKKFFLRGICLTSVAFVFQACYGTPQDFGLDLYIEGQVKSKNSGLPIKGIKVSVANSMQYTYTDRNGSFSFYTEKLDKTKILFQDIDLEENNSYIDKDTTIITSEKEKIYLDIKLEEK